MKIYDTKRMFEEYGEYEICAYCEHSKEYYESDTGYREINCNGGNPPEDCQEAIRIMLEEDEVDENKGDVKMESVMNLNVDLESLKRDIISSVKGELKKEIINEIKKDLIKKTYTQTVEPQLEEIKMTMTNLVGDLLRAEIESYYTEKKITIGGGYMSDGAKEYTVQEYTQKLLAESMENGKINFKKSKYDSDTYKIDEYILDKCIASETKSFMDKKIKSIQKDIDKTVRNTFETSVEKMMSEVALGVLKSNATYNEITQKLLGQ